MTITAPLAITYEVPDLTVLAAKYTGLVATTKEGYEAVRLGIGELRKLRVQVEARRKELKAGALEYNRAVDSAAALLTIQIEAIENPLKLAKSAVDEAKAKEKADREETNRRMLEEAAAQRLAGERAALEADRQALAVQRAEVEALRPVPAVKTQTDTEKVLAYAKQVRELAAAMPEIENAEARFAVREARLALVEIAQALEGGG